MVRLIFDADMMKKTMEGMSMDTQKMPLGKLSRRTINDVRLLRFAVYYMS